MNVVFIVRTAQGGMLSHIKTLAGGLKDKGYKICVIGDIDDNTKKLFELQGIDVYRVVFNNETNMVALLKCVRKIRRHLKKIKPDVIHMHGFIAAFVGRLACGARNKNIVVTIHNYMPKGRTSRILMMMERLLMRKTKAYIAVSNALRRYMTEVIGINDDKIVTIYNGIEDIMLKDNNDTQSGETVIVSMIRLIPAKGVEYLIKAMTYVNEKVKNSILYILGDGPYKSFYEKLIDDLNLDNVKLLGYRNDAKEILSEADLFVLPSLSEGLPVSCIEAMCEKKPVVATSVGGVPEEIIDGENGILVKAGDAKALASAIIAVVSDKNKALLYGQRGYERYKKLFSSDTMIDSTSKLYKKITS